MLPVLVLTKLCLLSELCTDAFTSLCLIDNTSPQVYIVHINRAGIGGEIGGDGYIRHANPVSFPDTLNLRDCGLLLTPDTPLDWNLEPCSTEYDLFGACFHRGKYT